MLKNFILKDNYNDSVVLMNAANSVRNEFSNKNVSAVMATPQNMELLESLGLLSDEGKKALSADLIFAVDADNAQAEKMFASFQKVMAAKSSEKDSDGESDISFDTALLDDAALVLMSIPGRYVPREAERALMAGKNVMVFSDNVPLSDEIRLKKLAIEKKLLFMGPDCGTCIINGKGLGFANVIKPGNIGIAGASGSGIQELTCAIDKMGQGMSQVIGVGGRDIKSAVGGLSLLAAMDLLESDKSTDVIVIISKPPDADVADKIISKAKAGRKKYVINFLTMELKDFGNIKFASNLEEAAVAACRLLNEKAVLPLSSHRLPKLKGKYLRALYAGGTLCYEALYLLKDIEIFSNTPINKDLSLKDVFQSVKNSLVDMGEDDFTRGYPHPMMDFTLRKQRIAQEAEDPQTGVILLDCTLGWGCHNDPAGELAEAIAEAKKINPGIVFVTPITGSYGDPQDYNAQQKKLEEAGAFVYHTNRQAVEAARGILFSE
ncbi:acyl-CoA synthetase FdrA [bacterium]|nr:acyl-CoA synthetase FdrA [Candidatus Omnitrophota bacterium]MBU2528571.1 acyl-CoA synthetase FdrA [bacterium]MBU3930349.1 acyl-CoA synthetase FdrA [bacterium]MBU4123489.1 acyl-CoA synthetase FdrA [bacterium]